MGSEDASVRKDRGQILRFPSRSRPGHPPLRPVSSKEPVTLQRFEHAPEEDDYRLRMRTNIAAFTLVVVLILCGIWLADSLGQLRKQQDCVLMGRGNCAQITVPPPRT